jgi:hypothetical protein
MSAPSTTRCPASAGSPLDQVEAAFRLLTTGPDPLAIDGAAAGHGLPARPVPLAELARLLRSPSMSAARDPAWRQVIANARSGKPEWTVAAAGLALPGLRKLAGSLARGWHGDPADLDAELLTALLEALRALDPDRPRIALRLWRAARSAGIRLRHADAACGGRHVPAEESSAPPPPAGHPDFVLADAVRQEVITAGEAALIGATRLEDVTLTAAAGQLGICYETAKVRRWRAETRLAAAIRAGQLSAMPPSAPGSAA